MPRSAKRTGNALDPVELELFNNRFAAVAEEMGAVLQQAGFSPNIKERRDFSCAIFDARGDMVTHAAHIPVHLGSTPASVRAALDAIEMGPGDIAILNDPYAGGTHLPDVTLVAPVFVDDKPKRGKKAAPLAYVADRAHHADIGGSKPGSMAISGDVHQEGFRMPPVLIVRAGEMVRETRELFLANTRVESERLGDLDAQIAALRAGSARLRELAAKFSEKTLATAMRELQAYSARLIEAFIADFPAGRHRAEDVIESDGLGQKDIAIRATIEKRGRRLIVDFSASDDQVRGPLNANRAVTTSAVFYAIACLAGRDVPANRGMMDPVEIRTRPGSIVDCSFPSAVAGGNVETSQRIVDVLARALASALPGRIPAASAGSMNNLAVGGHDSIRDRPFSYYETIAGGAGAGPAGPGASAVQTHMTNTLNTPVEALEAYYPFRVRHYRIRRRSGGPGKHPGGDGIDRAVEFLCDAELTLLTERRDTAPYGLAGGGTGKKGADTISRDGKTRALPPKGSTSVATGDVVRIQTPGGGGWGKVQR